MTTASPIVLEPAQQVADAFAKPPFMYDVSKLPVDEEWITVPAQVGDARVRIIKPEGAPGTLPVIV